MSLSNSGVTADIHMSEWYKTMIYILFGLLATIAFNLAVYLAFGAETFWRAPWVNYTTFAMIVGGVALAVLSEARCTICRSVGERWRFLCSGSCYW